MNNFFLFLFFLLSSIGYAQPGSIDSTFKRSLRFDQDVKSLAVQSDGKILVGGEFKQFNGQKCNGLIRLNSDGSWDKSFNISKDLGEIHAKIYTIAIQNDGKILAGGLFSDFSSTQGLFGDVKPGRVFNPQNIIRFKQDGSVDSSFNIGLGFDPWINVIKIQKDNKILVGGTFSYFKGYSGKPNFNSDGTICDRCKNIKYIARLNHDGTLDTTFIPPKNFRTRVNSIVVQEDNKILVAGSIDTNYDIDDKSKLIQRFNSDGSLDSSFNVGRSLIQLYIGEIKLTDNNQLIVSAGWNYKESTFSREKSFCVASRLNLDGSIDTNFACINAVNFSSGLMSKYDIYEIIIQKDGKIIIGGNFPVVNEQNHMGIARLNQDGTLDETFKSPTVFDPNFYPNIYALLLLPDGKIIAGHRMKVSVDNPYVTTPSLSRINTK